MRGGGGGGGASLGQFSPSETFAACRNTPKVVKLIIISGMLQVEKWSQVDEGFLEYRLLKGMNLPFSLAPC